MELIEINIAYKSHLNLGQWFWIDQVYAICKEYGGKFWYAWVLHGDSILLFKLWAPFEWFNCTWWVWNMCCLYCLQFLFCAIVLKVVKLQVISSFSVPDGLSLLSAILVLCNCVKSSKLQVISSCSEQNIFSLVDKCFNIFQYFCQDWLTDYSHIFWILTFRKHVQKELSFHMMKNQIQTCLLKFTKTGSASFSTTDE